MNYSLNEGDLNEGEAKGPSKGSYDHDVCQRVLQLAPGSKLNISGLEKFQDVQASDRKITAKSM